MADGIKCKECGDAITYGNLCPKCTYRLDKCTYCGKDGTFADCSMTCRECLTELYGLHECWNPLDGSGICIVKAIKIRSFSKKNIPKIKHGRDS